MTKELATYLRGWKSYFGFCETPSVLRVGKDPAGQAAGSRTSCWHLANSPALTVALPNSDFDSLGLRRLFVG